MRTPESYQHWFVYNPEGSNPKQRHENYGKASEEAKRLAKKNPGQRFIVLAPVGCWEVPTPEPTFTAIRPIID